MNTTDMELTFLGTGTSAGVPYIGCRCEVCRSTDPRDKRLRTSALLRYGDMQLLIDCGPDLRAQLLTHDVTRLDGCLITHYHYDHVGGIDDLRPFCYPDGFDIYCKADVESALRRQVPYCFAEHPYPSAPVLHPVRIEPLKPFHIKNLEIIPLPVKHYLLDIVGFRIGQLVYITDAKELPPETIQVIKGCDTLVINALRHKSHISHMNLQEALDVIKAVNPRKTWLIHMSHGIGLHAEASRMLPPGVELAYDGLTIEIPAR